MKDKKFIKLTPFKMQVLQSFPFIDEDFDAITNYELLCKVVEYLNKTIENVDFINDEFDSVKEEIDNAVLYLETNLTSTVEEVFNKYLEEGRLQAELIETYNSQNESLVLSIRMEDESNG